jgi:hypothetical protein
MNGFFTVTKLHLYAKCHGVRKYGAKEADVLEKSKDETTLSAADQRLGHWVFAGD